MLHNPYFFEKSMEMHNRKMEKTNRSGWMNGNENQPPAAVEAGKTASIPSNMDRNVCCQA